MNDNYLTILKTLNSGNVQDAGKMPYFRDAQLYLKLNRYINVRYEVTDKGKAYIDSQTK